MNTWPDGTPKSRGNAFDLGSKSRITESMNLSANCSKHSSALVNTKRAQGQDLSTIPGLSRKSDEQIRDMRRFHVYSKAGGMQK